MIFFRRILFEFGKQPFDRTRQCMDVSAESASPALFARAASGMVSVLDAAVPDRLAAVRRASVRGSCIAVRVLRGGFGCADVPLRLSLRRRLKLVVRRELGHESNAGDER